MRKQNLPDEHVDALREMHQAATQSTISPEVLEQKRAHNARVYGGLREWFLANMAPTVDACLYKFERLIRYYEPFNKVTPSAHPAVVVYKTSLRRLEQYHVLCVDSLRRRMVFPAWSIFRSMIETVGVLCCLDSDAGAAKRWAGYDSDGVIDAYDVPTARSMLAQCREKTYPKQGYLPVHKNLKHMDRITMEMWDHCNKMDHFSYESISVIFTKEILDDKMIIAEVLHGLSPDENLYVPLGLLWILVAEGFNHLYLLGRRIGLPSKTIIDVMSFLSEYE